MVQKTRIGIMGGTFNPIHQGHLILAELAREYCGLDEVLFIPSGYSYMKSSDEILDGKTRLSMTALAIEDNPFFTLSAMEVEREGATYTCDTIRELKKINPSAEYYFIMGADAFFTFEKWKNQDEILANCILAVESRDEKDASQLKEKAAKLQKKYQAEIIVLPERKIDLSSTEIRNRLKNGESVRYMIPDKVLSYIQKNRLYYEFRS